MSILVIVCFVAVGIQILYLLLFLWAFFRKYEVAVQKQSPHPVSVIVCAHDEEQNLKELIPLLLAQQHPQFEIIVVADRCNDGTYDYLLKATKEHSQLKMVNVTQKPEHINGKKFAITLGIKAACHEWLLFTDADCRPDSVHWIARMTHGATEQTHMVIGFSPYRKEQGLLNAFIRFEALLTGIQYIGLALVGRPYMGVGRNLAYTKSLFMAGRGFNNYLGVMGGDDDLFINLHAKKGNASVCIGQGATTVSIPKISWSGFLEQKLRHLSAGRHYKSIDKFIIGLFMASWMLTWFVALPVAIVVSVWPLLIAFIVRWVLLCVLFHRAQQRLGGQFEFLKTPILDFIFPFYYLVTGLRALVVKQIRWKS